MSRVNEVVGLISEQIIDLARSVSAEQHHPMRSGDEMDDYIGDNKKKIAKLRALREELENVWVDLL